MAGRDANDAARLEEERVTRHAGSGPGSGIRSTAPALSIAPSGTASASTHTTVKTTAPASSLTVDEAAQRRDQERERLQDLEHRQAAARAVDAKRREEEVDKKLSNVTQAEVDADRRRRQEEFERERQRYMEEEKKRFDMEQRKAQEQREMKAKLLAQANAWVAKSGSPK